MEELTNPFFVPNDISRIPPPPHITPNGAPTFSSPPPSTNGMWPTLITHLNYESLGSTMNAISGFVPHTNNIVNPIGVFNSEDDGAIYGKTCVIYPPDPNMIAKRVREKPTGCKTIFVGRLPDNYTEDLIRDIFERCGEIFVIRLSTKKYCHVKFVEESSVENAMLFNGYGIRLNSDPNTIHQIFIDYANARDDMYDYECKQRLEMMEERKKREREEEPENKKNLQFNMHYTEKEANNVIEKLKGEETFMEGIPVAVYWLEKGECTKRNVNIFYTMLQSCSGQIRRLMTDKKLCEEEFKMVKDRISIRVHVISNQVSEIEKLYISSSHKKVWDHFTKAQRKNIDLWKKLSVELKSWNLDNIITGSSDNEMDVSDSDDDSDSSRIQSSCDGTLKAENKKLKCELDAFKNEADIIKRDLRENTDYMTELKKKYTNLQEKYKDAQKQINILETRLKNKENDEKLRANYDPPWQKKISQKEAQILGLLSMFLHIHPYGVSLDYICSYLQKIIPSLRSSDVEDLLKKYDLMFKQDITGVGVNIEKHWRFIGFNLCNNLL